MQAFLCATLCRLADIVHMYPFTPVMTPSETSALCPWHSCQDGGNAPPISWVGSSATNRSCSPAVFLCRVDPPCTGIVEVGARMSTHKWMRHRKQAEAIRLHCFGSRSECVDRQGDKPRSIPEISSASTVGCFGVVAPSQAGLQKIKESMGAVL